MTTARASRLGMDTLRNWVDYKVCIVCGLWLLGSAFLWRHGVAHRINAYSVGGALVVLAMLSRWRREVLFATSLLAIWLAISAVTIPVEMARTRWNHLLVAALVFWAGVFHSSSRSP